MSKGRYVVVWNPSPATTTEEKAEAMQKAVETMMGGVRITCESTVITGNLRAARDWDEFDDCIEPAKARGLKLLIQFFPCGAREGSPGTGKWDCTDSKQLTNFSADDLAVVPRLTMI